MASGVKVSEEVKLTYEEIKKNKKYKYFTMVIKDGKIVIEKYGAKDSTYSDFLEDIMSCGPTDCRYGLFDYKYKHSCEGASETIKEKLIVLTWCPDTAKIKNKMLYASSQQPLKNIFTAVSFIQATDEAEASADEIEPSIRRTDRS